MIVPGKKPYKMPAMTSLIRLFFKFIDKNNITLEFDSDLASVVQLFAESVEYHLMMELGDDE